MTPEEEELLAKEKKEAIKQEKVNNQPIEYRPVTPRPNSHTLFDWQSQWRKLNAQ
jgi:hypothetical protein